MAAPLVRISMRNGIRLFCAKPFSSSQQHLADDKIGFTSNNNLGSRTIKKKDSPSILSFEEFKRQEEARKLKEKEAVVNKILKEENEDSFATLFRRSKFVQLGRPTLKYVLGRVFEVVNGDLYIDFGGKFHCVCTVPHNDLRKYLPGTLVVLQLYTLEQTSAFLGSTRRLTLLEADGVLMGNKPTLDEKFYAYNEK